MKKIIGLLVSLVPALAFAYPKVNDHVIYNGTYHVANSEQKVGFLQELNLTAFDDQKNEFTVQVIMGLPNGTEEVTEQQVAATEFMTQDQVKEILANCEAAGGKAEKVTVMAGEFDSCLVVDSAGNKTWLGDVPFNTIKSQSYDADKNMIELELSMFSQD